MLFITWQPSMSREREEPVMLTVGQVQKADCIRRPVNRTAVQSAPPEAAVALAAAGADFSGKDTVSKPCDWEPGRAQPAGPCGGHGLLHPCLLASSGSASLGAA